MKKIILFLHGLAAFAAYSQNTQSASPPCVPCTPGVYTSIGQLKDVKTTDKFYPDLKLLIEKYSVDVTPCTYEIFGGKQILTNMQFIQMLNTALDFMLEDIAGTTEEMSEESRDAFMKKIMVQPYDRFKHYYTSTYQIKDLKQTDCFLYTHLH
jgi:hypothetical protein